MVRCDLWVRLKVIDLVTQTAWMTLTEKLGLEKELLGLARYSFWRMDVDARDGKSALGEIERVICLDSAFTNQNKHLYMLRMEDGAQAGDLHLDRDYPIMAEGGVGRSGFAVDCLVRELGSEREEGYRSRLNSRLDGVRVTGIVAGEVWRVIIEAESEKEAVRKVEGIALTRSRREGLLLNPHYQRLEILSAGRL
jgi:hypothetical protein